MWRWEILWKYIKSLLKNKMNYFTDIALLASLSLKDQENLSDFCQIQKIQAGKTLFIQGDEPQALYIIQSGVLGIYKTQTDTSHCVAELKFWDIVWEMAFFGRPPRRNATVIAHQDTQLIVLLHYNLSSILEKYPNIHSQLQKIIQQRSES